MSKNPEHIDDLEQFYRDQLDDLSVEPPAEVWGNIQSKLKPGKPFYQKSSFVVTVATVLFTGTTLLLLTWKSEDKKAIDTFKEQHPVLKKVDSLTQPVLPSVEKTKATETKPEKPKARHKSVVIPSTNTQTNTTAEPQVKVEEPKTSEPQTETQETTEVTPVAEPEKTKPKSFYEKYSEQNKDKDTSRSLFKPGNK